MERHTLLKSLLVLAGFCLLNGQACQPGGDGPPDDGGTAAQNLAYFDQAWAGFDEYYSYFDYKGIDWDAVRTAYRPTFNADLTPDEFAVQLTDMLGLLSDWHVVVMRPDGTWLQTETGTVTNNYTSTPRNRYTLDGYTKLGDGIWHAWFENNIAYIRVDGLSDDVFGLYFVTDFGQLIVSSSSLKNIRSMEKKLKESPLGCLLMPGSKYEFKEPILYEFIQSEFDDFEEFVEYLNPEEEE